MQPGDTVRVEPDLTGTVRQVYTSGTVTDPLTDEELTASEADPVLEVDSDSGVLAVLTSEAKAFDPTDADLDVRAADLGVGVEVKTAYGRGLESWPGADATVLTRDEWAAARAEAFLSLVGGERTEGYTRDADLLPPT